MIEQKTEELINEFDDFLKSLDEPDKPNPEYDLYIDYAKKGGRLVYWAWKEERDEKREMQADPPAPDPPSENTRAYGDSIQDWVR